MANYKPSNIAYHNKVGKALLLGGGLVFLLGLALLWYSAIMESKLRHSESTFAEILLLLWIPTTLLGIAISGTGLFLHLYKK